MIWERAVHLGARWLTGRFYTSFGLSSSWCCPVPLSKEVCTSQPVEVEQVLEEVYTQEQAEFPDTYQQNLEVDMSQE